MVQAIAWGAEVVQGRLLFPQWLLSILVFHYLISIEHRIFCFRPLVRFSSLTLLVAFLFC